MPASIPAAVMPADGLVDIGPAAFENAPKPVVGPVETEPVMAPTFDMPMSPEAGADAMFDVTPVMLDGMPPYGLETFPVVVCPVSVLAAVVPTAPPMPPAGALSVPDIAPELKLPPVAGELLSAPDIAPEENPPPVLFPLSVLPPGLLPPGPLPSLFPLPFPSLLPLPFPSPFPFPLPPFPASPPSSK